MHKKADGTKMYQSSSVSSSPQNAFFKPRSIKSRTTKDKKEAQIKQKYNKGTEYLDRVYIEEEKGMNLLESRNYEKLCELIDYLEKNDKSRIYYQMLAAQVSLLQQAVNDDERYSL